VLTEEFREDSDRAFGHRFVRIELHADLRGFFG
jgi:hypothetical protein